MTGYFVYIWHNNTQPLKTVFSFSLFRHFCKDCGLAKSYSSIEIVGLSTRCESSLYKCAPHCNCGDYTVSDTAASPEPQINWYIHGIICHHRRSEDCLVLYSIVELTSINGSFMKAQAATNNWPRMLKWKLLGKRIYIQTEVQLHGLLVRRSHVNCWNCACSCVIRSGMKTLMSKGVYKRFRRQFRIAGDSDFPPTL
jgi:hypothetical protein